ncbi:hypothetical protein ACFE04_022747 [Oxalis oulophora]
MLVSASSLLHTPPPPPPPNDVTLKTHLLHNFNTPSQLKQIHTHLIKTNTPLSILPLTRVALICSQNSHFLYAHQILSRIEPNTQTFIWNSCLKLLSQDTHPINAITLFYQLRQYDILPDEYTCSFVLKACTRLNDISHGKIVHCVIEKLGFRYNTFLLNMLVHLYALSGEVGVAMLLFDKMSQRDVVTWNIMVTQLAKRRDIEGAYGLFLRMPDRSVRSWTAMISGFVQCGKPNEAISLFREMEDLGLKPNEVTVVAILAACADLGMLDLGREVHEYLNRSGFGKNVRICNTLIDMFVKCGCLEDAKRVFDEMEGRTIVSWSAMISGFAMHGKAEEALSLFNKMTEIGVIPNDITMIGLLHAFSHMGLVNEGRRFFSRMIKDYKIVPRIEHYGCMVDLFSRAGLLQEAHEFILNMPTKPNGVVWGALLGGCKVHNNIKLAEEAIRHLAVLDPLNDGYYVVLSNIYAEAERWDDVARVRKLMRDQGVKKKPAWSSITVNGKVHEFVAGDESHPNADEIFQMWDELLVKMKRIGYVPNTSVILLDIEEKEKEKFLFRHSEKLALVFGLINTERGTPIRIMKNLRVCEDCHSAFKLISSIVNRKIVVRDRNRFHCFENGSCSCKDYW